MAGDVSERTVRSCAESSISVASRLRLVSWRFALTTQYVAVVDIRDAWKNSHALVLERN